MLLNSSAFIAGFCESITDFRHSLGPVSHPTSPSSYSDLYTKIIKYFCFLTRLIPTKPLKFITLIRIKI